MTNKNKTEKTMVDTAEHTELTINGERWVRAADIPPVSTDTPPYMGVMLIETVTKYYVGMVVAVLQQEIVLRDACWVACTGRYHKMLAEGPDGNAELEPCPAGLVVIGRGSIVCAQPYPHGLIRVAK
jgi:hypothetical protein